LVLTKLYQLKLLLTNTHGLCVRLYFNPIASDNTYYTPYGMIALLPNSGPSTGKSEITIIGEGFQSSATSHDGDSTIQARCRFGVPGNYAIVEAGVLSS
jgi:hypothetical protein